jgi:hypothetical protein
VSTPKPLKCKVPGCNKPHHAQGYCQHCYDNLRKKKKAEVPKPVVKAVAHSKSKEAKQPAEEPVAPVRGTRTGRAAAAAPAPVPASQDGKSSRLVLLKARHEAMKREIDQIREDLESEDED